MPEFTDEKNPLTLRKDVGWQVSPLSRDQRELLNGHKGKVVWLTGLPGSGKSTLAQAVEANLHRSGFHAIVLDGDNLRHGLCADLGFSADERNENIRRAGEVAKLFMMQGTVVLVALVSPIRSAREGVRTSLPAGDFIEVYCNSSLAVCKARDPKGMYAQAEKGVIRELTGISAPYEAPLEPSLVLDTGRERVDESVDRLMAFLLPMLVVANPAAYFRSANEPIQGVAPVPARA